MRNIPIETCFILILKTRISKVEGSRLERSTLEIFLYSLYVAEYPVEVPGCYSHGLFTKKDLQIAVSVAQGMTMMSKRATLNDPQAAAI